jgi:hypothetical protein
VFCFSNQSIVNSKATFMERIVNGEPSYEDYLLRFVTEGMLNAIPLLLLNYFYTTSIAVLGISPLNALSFIGCLVSVPSLIVRAYLSYLNPPVKLQSFKKFPFKEGKEGIDMTDPSKVDIVIDASLCKSNQRQTSDMLTDLAASAAPAGQRLALLRKSTISAAAFNSVELARRPTIAETSSSVVTPTVLTRSESTTNTTITNTGVSSTSSGSLSSPTLSPVATAAPSPKKVRVRVIKRSPSVSGMSPPMPAVLPSSPHPTSPPPPARSLPPTMALSQAQTEPEWTANPLSRP